MSDGIKSDAAMAANVPIHRTAKVPITIIVDASAAAELKLFPASMTAVNSPNAAEATVATSATTVLASAPVALAELEDEVVPVSWRWRVLLDPQTSQEQVVYESVKFTSVQAMSPIAAHD